MRSNHVCDGDNETHDLGRSLGFGVGHATDDAKSSHWDGWYLFGFGIP
jgi:hypothetical protein